MTKKVILIEDDTMLRASIVQTLDLEGFEVLETSSFTQARRSIRSSFPGVILSDIKMPDHSGFDVLKFVQNKDPDLPTILITGHSDVATAMRAMKDGAYDYLEKPCSPEKLIETLERALTHRRLVLENRTMQAQLTAIDQDDGTLVDRLSTAERKIIEGVLNQTNGSVAQAAEILNVPRNTLYDRLSKHKISAKFFR